MEIKTNNSPTFEEIAIIEKATGGKIGTHEWWVVKENSESFKSIQKPSHDADIIDHGILENSFISHGKEYIGDFDRAQWYYKYKMKVYEPYPHGVAERYNEDGTLMGYHGYTHRGGCTFKIGDKFFDDNYKPKEEDYESEQWVKWVKEYDDGIAEAEGKGDTWWANDIKRDGIARFIPFQMRGAKTIKTWDDAIQAAINMSKHLS